MIIYKTLFIHNTPQRLTFIALDHISQHYGYIFHTCFTPKNMNQYHKLNKMNEVGNAIMQNPSILLAVHTGHCIQNREHLHLFKYVLLHHHKNIGIFIEKTMRIYQTYTQLSVCCLS